MRRAILTALATAALLPRGNLNVASEEEPWRPREHLRHAVLYKAVVAWARHSTPPFELVRVWR